MTLFNVENILICFLFDHACKIDIIKTNSKPISNENKIKQKRFILSGNHEPSKSGHWDSSNTVKVVTGIAAL